jgi:SNF family Na+-dependent transporter
MFETILFSWIFGMDKGWREITSGADIKVPNIYKFIIKYITPVLLIIIFLGSLFKPLGIIGLEMFLFLETDGH